jgi:hypothetical protein
LTLTLGPRKSNIEASGAKALIRSLGRYPSVSDDGIVKMKLIINILSGHDPEISMQRNDGSWSGPD